MQLRLLQSGPRDFVLSLCDQPEYSSNKSGDKNCENFDGEKRECSLGYVIERVG